MLFILTKKHCHMFFNQDPSEFEWSFWTEWGKKSLLWTFTGHLILSRLLTVFCTKVGNNFRHYTYIALYLLIY